jgi:hypothetical protein
MLQINIIGMGTKFKTNRETKKLDYHYKDLRKSNFIRDDI